MAETVATGFTAFGYGQERFAVEDVPRPAAWRSQAEASQTWRREANGCGEGRDECAVRAARGTEPTLRRKEVAQRAMVATELCQSPEDVALCG